MTVQVLHENCEYDVGKDTTLPYTAYIVTYKIDGKEHHDVAISSKTVDIFDHYYDKYKKDFVTMKQTEGRVNPNLWAQQSAPQPPPKKKRRKN